IDAYRISSVLLLVLFVFHHFKQLPFFLKRTAKVVLFSSLPNLFLPFFVFFITLFLQLTIVQ
ncbi:MAG: hypothetical protein IKL26_06030, partial [Bacteroidales bacterium]|nr:hypothetical protein [Bacteroidales bacterium]